MSNIVDYVDWRGDLTLKASAFNEIDALILTQLAMIDLDGIVPSPKDGGDVSLSDAAAAFFADKKRSETPLGLIIPKEIIPLFGKLGKSRRFSEMRLCAYVNNTDVDAEQQFSAITVRLGDGSVFVSFRGTDDTLVGWKEDLNLAFLPSIPSQVEAVTYFDNIGKRMRGAIRVGGHSKGGNLAVFSAVKCRNNLRKRIREVYNFDGPGFSREFLSLPAYHDLDGRIKTVVPQSSLVGMLFENDEKYTVVKSIGNGIFQHNAFLWEVERTSLQRLSELTAQSREVSKQINTMLRELDGEARKRFVESVYGVLVSTEATTLTELYSDKLAVLRSIGKVDKETRKLMKKLFGLIIGDGGGQLFVAVVNSFFKNRKNTPVKTDAEKDKKE